MNKIRCLKSALFSALIVVCVSGCGKETATYIQAETVTFDETESQTQELEVKETEEVETLLYVYVCGAIENPGVYTIPKGSRVCDVFALAGGFSKNAATDYWNQARLLTDGEMIYVPTKEEAKDRKPETQSSRVLEQSTEQTTGKVNINTASKTQLMTIPGVGETRAQAILSFREANGPFSSIEDVMKVEGIKDGVYAKMKEYIVIN